MPPQIPSTFAPDTTLDSAPSSPASASRVDPMQNAAPGQQQQIGDAVLKAGSEEQSIAQRIQYQGAEAQSRAAETQFIQSSTQIARGDGTTKNPGFMNLRGQQAVDGYQAASEALAKAQNDGLESLSTPFAKQLYEHAIGERAASLGGAMSDHKFQQLTAVNIDTATGAAASYGSSASLDAIHEGGFGLTDTNGNPVGLTAANTQESVANAKIAYQLRTGDNDLNSPGNQLVAQQQRGKIYADYAISQLQPGSGFTTLQAQKLLTTIQKPGLIDSASQMRIASPVKSFISMNAPAETMTKLLTNASATASGWKSPAGVGIGLPLKAGGSMVVQNPAQNGISIMAAPSTKMLSPVDGTVTDRGTDDAGVPYMEITASNGAKVMLTGMNGYSAKVGEQVSQGEAIGLSGNEGSQKSASVLMQVTDPNGKVVDPAQCAQPAQNINAITSTDVENAALAAIPKDMDPKLQEATASAIDLQVKHNQQIAKQAQDQAFAAASNQMAQYEQQHGGIPNVKAIDGPTWSALTPVQQEGFMQQRNAAILKQYNQGQEFKTMNETSLVAYFNGNPQELTPANVDAAHANGNLSNATYLQLQSRATKLQKDTQAVVEAQGINARIKYFGTQAGLNVYPSQDADKQKLNELTYKINNDIDQIKQQNHGKATPAQVDQAIKNELIEHTVQTSAPRSLWHPTTWSDSPEKKYSFQVPPGAIDTALGSDGKMHYRGANKEDLGVVQ